jgi:hypothetical protein
VALPTLWWRFPHDSHCYKPFPSPSKPGGGGATPAFSSPLVYLQFAWGIAPPPLSGARGALPSLLHVFFFFFFSCSFIIQFVFFSFFIPPGWGSVCPGAMLFWPRVVCGSTACRLAHLVVCVFPSSLGAGVWWRESSSGGVGLRCMGWGHGGVRVWPLLGGFSCKVYLQCLSKILL